MRNLGTLAKKYILGKQFTEFDHVKNFVCHSYCPPPPRLVEMYAEKIKIVGHSFHKTYDVPWSINAL